MAMLSVSSALQPKTSILPEGGRDFLRRRLMEIVGVATAGFGLVLMMALFMGHIYLGTVGMRGAYKAR